MKKHLAALTLVVAACVSLGQPALVAFAQNQPVPPAVPVELPEGEFRITPSKAKDSVIIEANHAPLLSVLQAVAQQTNRKIIMSDEALQKAKELRFFIYRPVQGTAVMVPIERTLEGLLDMYATTSLSWGKLGEDTYLVVWRKESADEAAAQKTRTEKAIEQWRKRQEEASRKTPEPDPFDARVWLLAPVRQ